MTLLQTVSVKLTNSQRKSLNASETMRNLRTRISEGDLVTHVSVERFEAMGQDKVLVNTDKNVFTWIITPRGRIVGERTAKR